MSKTFLFSLFLSVIFTSPVWAREPNVIVSIRPLHSLVAGVMSGIAEPKLLVDGNASPHLYQIKPSQREMLSNAEVIFYLDPRFETFLMGTLRALPLKVKAVALAKDKKIKLRSVRPDGVWKAYETEDDEKLPPQVAKDYHLWLDPKNAIAMTRAIAALLSERYPEYKADFAKNQQAMENDFNLLDRQLTAVFTPVKDRPFFVFHDGLQYLQRRYGLYGAGAIVMNLETPLAAARLQEVRNRIVQARTVCVFSEPQFSERVVKAVTEGIPVNRVEVDILGTSLRSGKGLYRQMMLKLAGAMSSCLANPAPSGGNAPSGRQPQDAPQAPRSSSPSEEGKRAP